MRIFLFSNHFPFGKSEPFIANEISFACQLNEVSIHALYKTTEVLHQGQFKSNGFLPLFNSKIKLLLNGVFNTAPLRYHIQEIFKPSVFCSPAKLKQQLISLIVTRAVISTSEWKSLIQEAKSYTDCLFYFYWGDNLAWTIPYLLDEIKGPRRVVIRMHRTDLYEYLKSNHAPLREVIFKNASLICPISEDGVNYLKDRYPNYSSKIRLFRLGVFDKGLNPINKSNKVVCVSASYVTPVKQVHLIFHALKKLHLEVEWHHFGDGPLFSQLNNLLSDKRDNLEVVLHGAVPNEQLLEFYCKYPVDIFINVSQSEGVPVSIMEALAFGIPVIAPNVGGIAELIDENNGSLLPANFEEIELTNTIKRMFEKCKRDRDGLRFNARRTFELLADANRIYPEFYEAISIL